MSHHVLHIFRHGVTLKKNRGLLTMHDSEIAETKTIPIEDIRAVIIAAQGCQISTALISDLLAQQAVILHCDQKYAPSGWTVPIHYVTRSSLIEVQPNISSARRKNLWHQLIATKVLNQHGVLKKIDSPKGLKRFLNQNPPNEASSAKAYWREYFPFMARYFENPGINRSDRHSGQVNAHLNYGYAVLSALVHRSIIIHGMNPIFGIHHQFRYRSWPLVYDLMEPLRPFVDQQLMEFCAVMTQESEFVEWARHVGLALKDMTVKARHGSFKLLDAIDLFVREFASALVSKKIRQIYIPRLEPGNEWVE